jgi:hypothetical protein
LNDAIRAPSCRKDSILNRRDFMDLLVRSDGSGWTVTAYSRERRVEVSVAGSVRASFASFRAPLARE